MNRPPTDLAAVARTQHLFRLAILASKRAVLEQMPERVAGVVLHRIGNHAHGHCRVAHLADNVKDGIAIFLYAEFFC